MALVHKQKVSLTLNPHQLKAFSDDIRMRFEKKAITHLRKKFPVSLSHRDDKELAHFLIEGIREASKYNIVDRPDVLDYVEYFFILGNDFDTDSAYLQTNKVLKIRNLSGHAKMERMKKAHPLNPETL